VKKKAAATSARAMAGKIKRRKRLKGKMKRTMVNSFFLGPGLYLWFAGRFV
jgi:hypothetical protein